jgi:hypothetical protein
VTADRVLADLDRCEHGRHQGDQCFSCPDGLSPGNPHLRPGQTIGYGLDGVPIVVPTRARKYNAANWYQADAPAVAAPHPCIVERRDDAWANAGAGQLLVRCRCHMNEWATWRPGDVPVTCPETRTVLTDGDTP